VLQVELSAPSESVVHLAHHSPTANGPATSTNVAHTSADEKVGGGIVRRDSDPPGAAPRLTRCTHSPLQCVRSSHCGLCLCVHSSHYGLCIVRGAGAEEAGVAEDDEEAPPAGVCGCASLCAAHHALLTLCQLVTSNQALFTLHRMAALACTLKQST
jgi:hypothetical protein